VGQALVITADPPSNVRFVLFVPPDTPFVPIRAAGNGTGTIPAVTVTVVDAENDIRLADYRNVPDPELLERRGIFVAEGRLVVSRLLASRFTTRSVMVTRPAYESLATALDTRPDVPVYVVSQAAMDAITGFHIHRGCLAIGERPQAQSWREVVKDARGARHANPRGFAPQEQSVVIVLERVGNADNVGGIFRNAAAFGARAVLLDPSSTDPLYRKAIRTSMAATLAVPFARALPWPDMLRELRDDGVAVVAMTPSASALPMRECAAQIAGRPVAVVLGHEGEGLTSAALEACEYQARIPMASGVDSLNVASAAAVALSELRTRV
jgi:tRNA G18 (ribose-2'-O)-methylase SpoU